MKETTCSCRAHRLHHHLHLHQRHRCDILHLAEPDDSFDNDKIETADEVQAKEEALERRRRERSREMHEILGDSEVSSGHWEPRDPIAINDCSASLKFKDLQLPCR